MEARPRFNASTGYAYLKETKVDVETPVRHNVWTRSARRRPAGVTRSWLRRLHIEAPSDSMVALTGFSPLLTACPIDWYILSCAMGSPAPLDAKQFEQFFWFFFSAGLVVVVGDTSLRWISGFPRAKYRRLFASAASACGIIYWLFILLLLSLPEQSLILCTLSQAFLFAGLCLANVSRAIDLSNFQPWSRYQKGLACVVWIVVVCSGPVVIVLIATYAPRLQILKVAGIAIAQSVADFSTTSIWVVFAWKAQGEQKRRTLFQTILRLAIVPFGIFWMLWPLASTQWHLRHSIQGLFQFQMAHICWSTLGTEGWGCFTVIFKDEGNPHPSPARNCRPQDDQLHLVKDQSEVALTRRTGTDNTQAGDNDEQRRQHIWLDTTSSSVSRAESWKREVCDNSVGDRDRECWRRISWEAQDEETGHQTKIRWNLTCEVTKQIEAAPSEGQEDSKPNSHVWIEGPWKNDVPADNEETNSVAATTSCH